MSYALRIAPAVSRSSGVATVPGSMPARISRWVRSASSSRRSSADSTLGSRTAWRAGHTIASRSWSASLVSRPLMRTDRSRPSAASASSDSRTRPRARAFSVTGTESSRSRMSRSAPDLTAFGTQSGRCPGTKSPERWSRARFPPPLTTAPLRRSRERDRPVLRAAAAVLFPGGTPPQSVPANDPCSFGTAIAQRCPCSISPASKPFLESRPEVYPGPRAGHGARGPMPRLQVVPQPPDHLRQRCS